MKKEEEFAYENKQKNESKSIIVDDLACDESEVAEMCLETNMVTKKKKTKRIILIAISSVVMVFALGLIGILVISNSPKIKAEKYFCALYNADVRQILSYEILDENIFADIIQKSFSEKYDTDVECFEAISDKLEVNVSSYKECVDKMCMIASDKMKEDLTEEYGENYTVSVKVTKCYEISSTKIKEINDEIETAIDELEDVNVDYKPAKKIMKVTCSIYIDDEYVGEKIVYVGKFGTKNRVIPEEGLGYSVIDTIADYCGYYF